MKKKGSLNFKMSARMILITGFFCVVLVLFSYRAFEERFIQFYEEKAENISRATAGLVDGNKISGYKDSLTKDTYYKELETMFTTMKEKTGVAYLYMFAPDEKGFTYLLDAKLPTDHQEDICELGEYYEYGDVEYEKLVPDIQAKKASSQVVLGADVGYGESVTAWAPVMDDNGNLVAMVEADYYLNDVKAAINRYVFRVTIIIVAGLVLILIGLLLNAGTLVLRPLKKLTNFVESYENGEANMELAQIHTNDEMQILAESFQDMITKIDDYVEHIRVVSAEKERIGTELNVATRIQANMLPTIFPAFPEREEFDVFSSMTPAKEVGGDFYDFFLVDEDHLALVMADVSGKGVPAALFMVISKTLLKNSAQAGLSPKEILEKVNNQLCENNDAAMFVTVWIGIMTISTGKIICANGGHEYPVIKKLDGKYELFQDPHGFVLAGIEDSKYKEYEIVLQPGEKLFLYTDGVPEATSGEEELFGTDRMLEILNANADASPKETLEAMLVGINRFVGDAPQFDDITMTCLEMKKRWETKEKRVSPSEENIQEAEAFVEEAFEELGLPMKEQTVMNIAMDEIFSNIVHYSKAREVIIICKMREDKAALILEDDGIPYNPLEHPDPDITASAEDRELGGLGILMVKKSMNQMSYENLNGRNCLTMILGLHQK